MVAPKGEEMPVLSERRNVIVMSDEAHRSQYEEFARNLTAALPNATRIGFTGTPIERGDRSTRLTFGDYVSIYNITRAVEDGATVPIYYEPPGAATAARLPKPEVESDRVPFGSPRVPEPDGLSPGLGSTAGSNYRNATRRSGQLFMRRASGGTCRARCARRTARASR
jgi:hypothetical protein